MKASACLGDGDDGSMGAGPDSGGVGYVGLGVEVELDVGSVGRLIGGG